MVPGFHPGLRDPVNRVIFDNEAWVMQAMEAQGFIKNAQGDL